MSQHEPFQNTQINQNPLMGVWRLRFGVIILICTLVLFALGRCYPQFMQQWYLRGLFQLWRIAYDFTLGLLPIPSALLLLGVLIWKYFRSPKLRLTWKSRWIRGLSSLIWTFNLFMWLWGFNYASAPLVTDLQAKPSRVQLFEWAMEVQHRLNNTSSMELQDMPEDEVRLRLEAFLTTKNWPVLGRVRARAWFDAGVIRYAGIGGIYLPWFMEGHTSSTHPQEVLSFVRTHEMAHGYGISGEGEADYCAYMALKTLAQNDWDRQAVWMADYELWCTLRRLLASSSEGYLDVLNQQINPDLMSKHQRVKKDAEHYHTAAANVAAISNDFYLRSMGIQDGIINYDQMVLLIWQEEHPKHKNGHP